VFVYKTAHSLEKNCGEIGTPQQVL